MKIKCVQICTHPEFYVRFQNNASCMFCKNTMVDRPVVDAAEMLKGLHVLLVLVGGEADETHPVVPALVTCVHVVMWLALTVHLQDSRSHIHTL